MIKRMYNNVLKKINYDKNEEVFDWKLFYLILCIACLGVVIIITKINVKSTIDIAHDMHRLNTIVYIVIGLIFGVIIYFFDYKKIKKYSFVLYLIATCIMLLSCVKGLTFKVNGIFYIRLFGTTISIVTTALPLYIISFVGFIINDKKNDERYNYKKDKSIKKKMVIFILAIISLILMMIDLSFTNMIILVISYLIIITIKIIKERNYCILKLGTVYGFVVSIICVFTVIIVLQQSVNWSKVEEYINVNIENADNGSNMLLQREIIRNAKMVGEAENLSVPIDETIFYSESNYTFIYIIGKMGLYYAEIIVVLYIFIAIKLMLNVKKVKDEYGRYLTVGLGALFIVQSFATMFVNISLGIYADVNLPFITYGGSYFIVNMFEIALLFSIYRRRIMYNIES